MIWFEIAWMVCMGMRLVLTSRWKIVDSESTIFGGFQDVQDILYQVYKDQDILCISAIVGGDVQTTLNDLPMECCLRVIKRIKCQ